VKIGFFDFETTNLDARFGQLLCGVVGENNSADPYCPILHTFVLNDYEGERWNDKSLAQELRVELERYDLLFSYNGARFDVPFLNTRLKRHRLRGARIARHKDLLYTMRGKFRMGSNRLEVVEEFVLGSTNKTRLNPETWRMAIMGHEDSYQYVIDHCQADVQVLARLTNEIIDVAGVLR
jgi:uncharacterized protein YprB with RNaseH-like and TPR domain